MQTAVTQDPVAAAEGMIADTQNKTIWSAYSDQRMPFGRVAVFSDEEHRPYKVQLPAASFIQIAGMVARDSSIEDDPGFTDHYREKTLFPIVRKGYVWAITEEAVTAIQSPVHVRNVASGTTLLGAVRTTAVLNETIPWENAQFVSTAAAGELIIIEIS